MAQQYLSTDPNAGTVPAAPKYLSTDPNDGADSRETSNLIPAEGLSGTLRNVAGAIAEPVASMASGMIAKPAADVAGLTALGSEMISPKGGSPLEFKQDVQRNLTYEPKTEWGAATTKYNPIALIGRALGYGGEKAGEAIRGTAGSDTARGAAGNAVQEAIPQIPAFAGVKAGKAIKEGIPGKQAALDVTKGEQAGVDAMRQRAKDTGYITPPEGGVRAAAAGLAGKAKVDKWLSAKNAENAQRQFAKEINLPEGTALTNDALKVRKDEAYKKYDAMEKLPGPKLQPTPAFQTAMMDSLKKVEDKIKFDAVTYKGLRPAASLLRSWSKKTDFPSGQTLQAIKDLRSQAKDDFIGGRREVATARLGVATQLENLFEENLAKTGQQGAVAEFKAARADLAKINFMERVTNPETGAVDLAKVGNLANTKAYKGALTGALKDAADFSNSYRKAAQKNVEAPPSLSVFDGLFALGAIGAGHPLLAAGEIAGRTAVPYAATKGMLQKPPPSYEVSRTRKAAPKALSAAGLGASSQANQLEPPP